MTFRTLGGGYSCTRDDWQWVVRDHGGGSKLIEGVVFNDGHRIMFVDMPAKQMDLWGNAIRHAIVHAALALLDDEYKYQSDLRNPIHDRGRGPNEEADVAMRDREDTAG